MNVISLFHWCRLKILATATMLSRAELWGETISAPVGLRTVTGALVLRTAVAALKGNSTAAGQARPVDGHIFFFPFFFCKLMLVVLKPPAPKQRY